MCLPLSQIKISSPGDAVMNGIPISMFYWHTPIQQMGFPGGASGKEPACQCRRLKRLICGWGRSPGEGNGNALWYSCLENPMDGGAWWATVHGVAESDTIEQGSLVGYSLCAKSL